MFKENKFMDDSGFFPGDMRRRASYTDSNLADLGFRGFPLTSASDGFRFPGDRTTSMTPILNSFVNQQSPRNFLKLNTRASMADIDLGLCQNLSKMSIYDEERSIFTGSHPSLGFSGSRNLHGCSRFDQDLTLYESFLEVSSRRQGLVQSSHGEVSIRDGDYHRLRLLGLEDYPKLNPNPNHRGFKENTSRQHRDYLLEQINQQNRRDISLFPEKYQLDFQEMRGNTIFQSLSAIGGSRDREGSSKCMKEDLALDLASMIGIYGSMYLVAKDQMGCRFLQRLVEEGSFLDAMIIFKQLINHVIELGMDQFGNYLIQKLIQVCNEEQRTQILIMLTSKPGLLVKISLHKYGTRVVQKLIETVTTKAETNLVKSALKPALLSLVRDVNGNHVIRSCLKSLREDNKFVLEGATRFCAAIATHRHGCCVLQHCVEYSVGPQREKLIAEISKNSLHLAQDPFGNYVVQYIIEQKLGGVDVMSELRGNYVKLATQKFSSHVVEKCLTHYPESRSQIVRELVSVPNFEHLLQDPFANYVIQSALSKTEGYHREILVEKVRRFGNLKMSQYSKKIFSKSRILKM